MALLEEHQKKKRYLLWMQQKIMVSAPPAKSQTQLGQARKFLRILCLYPFITLLKNKTLLPSMNKQAEWERAAHSAASQQGLQHVIIFRACRPHTDFYVIALQLRNWLDLNPDSSSGYPCAYGHITCSSPCFSWFPCL